jgi:alpha,alpha-trehalase
MKNQQQGWRVAVLVGAIFLAQAATAQQAKPAATEAYSDVLKYISRGWDVLTRSLKNCETVPDPKLPGQPVLYLPADFPVPPHVRDLEQRCNVRIEQLPQRIEKLGAIDMRSIPRHGLLYLERDYVVPGGFFNEMYGWDSYFIIVGLLRDQRLDLAQGMVDNFLFEVEHYGALLNANRTYYLTRSQPPFLTSMITDVYRAQEQQNKADKQWLARAYDLAVKDYKFWVEGAHLAGNTGLSRYYDFGEGPVAEVAVVAGSYYRDVVGQFLQNRDLGKEYLTSPKGGTTTAALPAFAIQVCETSPGSDQKHCQTTETLALSADFYKGDRSMRESGFDISFRFGPFSGSTHHYAPVCLNSLLYKAETDLEQISGVLGRTEEARQWRQRAQERRQRMQRYFWNAARGMFFDFNFTKNQRSTYEYASTFYPLWAGAATAEQASAVVRNLAKFEQPGGVVMSTRETKVQWDYPYGWAPIQLIAVEGLRRYGFHADADRLSKKFLDTVTENFRSDGTIREKYNVVTRSSESDVVAGYKENVVGFGWTNGVFLQLLKALRARATQKAQSAPHLQRTPEMEVNMRHMKAGTDALVVGPR